MCLTNTPSRQASISLSTLEREIETVPSAEVRISWKAITLPVSESEHTIGCGPSEFARPGKYAPDEPHLQLGDVVSLLPRLRSLQFPV